MSDVFIFPVDTPVGTIQKEWFRKSGFELSPWAGTQLVHTASAVLLVSPVYCSNRKFVYPDRVWKRYLQHVNPGVRLIRVGLREVVDDPNYLHWFHLPQSFEQFLGQAKTVIEMPLPSPSDFIPLERLWKRFRDGHDKGGFDYYFSAVIMALSTAVERLQGGNRNLDAEMGFLQDLDFLLRLKESRMRLEQYLPYWGASPFSEQVELLKTKISCLDLDWGEGEEEVSFSQKLFDLWEHVVETERILKEIAPYFKI